MSWSPSSLMHQHDNHLACRFTDCCTLPKGLPLLMHMFMVLPSMEVDSACPVSVNKANSMTMMQFKAPEAFRLRVLFPSRLAHLETPPEGLLTVMLMLMVLLCMETNRACLLTSKMARDNPPRARLIVWFRSPEHHHEIESARDLQVGTFGDTARGLVTSSLRRPATPPQAGQRGFRAQLHLSALPRRVRGCAVRHRGWRCSTRHAPRASLIPSPLAQAIIRRRHGPTIPVEGIPDYSCRSPRGILSPARRAPGNILQGAF